MVRETVCLDSQILSWGIHARSLPEQSDMCLRAERFIRWLTKEKVRILIPTVVLGETLINITDASRHAAFIATMQKQFEIVEFDALAAAFFARIFLKKKGTVEVERLRAAGVTRAQMKADYMIVATALAQRSDCIYSNDGEDLPKFARDLIEVRLMPDMPQQLSIPDEAL